MPAPPSFAPSHTSVDLVDAASHALARLLIALGAVSVLSGIGTLWWGGAGHLGVTRLGLGAAVAAIGGCAELLRRRHRPRLGSLLALAATLAAIALHALGSQRGVHVLLLGGAALIVALGGILVSLRAALALAAAHAGVVVLLFELERRGAIAGFAALTPAISAERVITLVMLCLAGLATAVLVRRMVDDSLARAQQHERQLERLLQMGTDWTWEQDRHGHLTYLSPEFERHTGRAVAEFMQSGRPGGPRIAEDAELVALRESMRRHEPYRNAVITYLCADGRQLVVCGCGEPVFGPDGGVEGWHGVSRDVTTEVTARREQQRTQAMLDRMVRMSPDAICVARSDGTVLVANDEFFRLIDRPADEAIGRRAVELGLLDAEASLRLRDAILATGVVRDWRTQLSSAGRGLRQVAITAGTFEWDGEPVAVITTRDITDSERSRLESEAILDNASVAIALVRDGRFERVNPLLESLFGHPPGSLGGASTGVLFPDADRWRAFTAKFENWRGPEGQIDVERSVARRDGSRFLARLRGRPVDPQRPRDGGMIWVVEDVTERHRAERELADAKHQAEAANAAKSAFLATMSHEIRTPLNGVLGLARLLQDRNLGRERREEYLEHLVASAEQLTGIVSDVLDLSKIEAGQLEIEDVEFDLHRMVHETFHTFAVLGQERGLAMDCHIAGHLPLRVRGDPVRVRQILANYLANALKFTARGGISLAAEPGDEDRVRFTVSDSGIGVDDELRERLFRPFVQADSSTTRRFGGTGLGLSICAELAKRMGGAVGIERVEGGGSGSRFWVELALPPVIDVARAAPLDARPRQALDGLRIVVAEDNPVNMLIVAAMLERLGAVVLQAEDGEQALVLLQQHAGGDQPVHAVLMDLHMPLLDGLTATRRLRQQPWGAALPVYALSAAVLDQERRDAQDAGMNGFIAKPVAEEELLRALQPLARRAVPVSTT